MKRQHRDRLDKLEDATGSDSRGIVEWTTDEAARWLARFIQTGEEPKHPRIRVVVFSAGCCVLRGVEAVGDKSPEECSKADLLSCYRRGGSCEYNYMGDREVVEKPPTPESWKSLEARLDTLSPPLSPPPRPPPTAEDWEAIREHLWAM